ncbi:hypothetical protein PanWU01x14_088890 [Parasponia andersonii]|uniref:Uncharacterized protein n=1 Tax=Parasponia andersonii TaxID=3476 RepID=A0A2P5D865_PARAD|nr:hypothetical protein PanWU01x14_088890 [Parasponia andersonii]
MNLKSTRPGASLVKGSTFNSSNGVVIKIKTKNQMNQKLQQSAQVKKIMKELHLVCPHLIFLLPQVKKSPCSLQSYWTLKSLPTERSKLVDCPLNKLDNDENGNNQQQLPKLAFK